MNFLHRPGADEYPPSFSEYVECIGAHEDILDVLTAQLKQVVSRLKAVEESRGDYRYAPGKWTIKEIIGHLCDTERVFAYRALRIGRGDVTPLPSFDDQSYVSEFRADGRTLTDVADEWGAVRSATTTLFQYLPAPAWQRQGIAGDSRVTVRALAYIMAGHVRHHIEVLEARYIK